MSVCGGYAFEGKAEVGKKNNIAIDVAEQVISRDFLSTLNHVVEALRPKFIAFDVRLGPGGQGTGLGRQAADVVQAPPKALREGACVEPVSVEIGVAFANLNTFADFAAHRERA